MIRSSGFFFLMLVFVVAIQVCIANVASSMESHCSAEFAKLSEDFRNETQVRPGSHPGEFRANGIWITGESSYPLSMVRESLGLTDKVLSYLPKDSRILSVGEGASELTPSLLKTFPNTKALDIWYDEKNLPESLRTYVAKNRPHLIAASATDIPLPDKSQDLILSNYVITNFKFHDQVQKSLDEMFRVLKPGGSAHITVFKKNIGTKENPIYQEFDLSYLQALKAKYGDELVYRIEDYDIKWNETIDGVMKVKTKRGQRLILERHLGGW